MATAVVGTGRSLVTDTKAAGGEAVAAARRALGGRRPAFGFVFAGPDHNLAALMSSARAAADGASLLGCSTAGEFTAEGLTHGGVAVLLVAAEETEHRLAFASGLKENHAGTATALCREFPALQQDAVGRRLLASTTVLLTDGLAGTAEPALALLGDSTGIAQQIVGGAAGDEGRFRQTTVAAGESVGVDAMAALHVFSSKSWGVGVGHGLRPASAKMQVTRARANVLHQIDGRPAFDVYRDYAKTRGVALAPETAGPFLIGNELGIYLFDRLNRARAPLSVDPDGSLRCAAEVPEGASVCILDGEPESMVAAAGEAAQEAAQRLGGPAAGVLVFDCVCRGMILKEEFGREIAAVRRVFGDVPVAGFLTYGEIARYGGKLDGWHNTTAVVVAIPA
jgi:methyl-accepting chemotaxis protein